VQKREGDGDSKEVMRCARGSYFGERALLKNEPRAATVVASGAVTLLRLDRNAFSLLLGPLDEIMQEGMKRYDNPNLKPKTAPSGNLNSRTKIPFGDLKVLGTLGKGSFGHVQLVADPQGNTYALKAVSRAQIVATGQQGHIMSEKRVMEKFDHPFLVKLFATYKDQNRLYFLLEPSLGGELFSVLRMKTLFDEDTARFCAGCVLLAFEYMHGMDIVYRDLKPENLLLDEKGYIKVTDFGFAKDISGGRTWTLCGTPDYLAPEIVAGKGHGKGVDWWTLGVFIYELLASYPPFYDEDPMKTYAKIMHGGVVFPSHFTKDAQSIVRKLLHHKPTKRLGVAKGGATNIKKHPWFKDFSFEDLINFKIKSSIVPKIKDNKDISNFDEYPEEADDIEPYEDDGSNWDADF
jgi:serine/threonine protein kinase